MAELPLTIEPNPDPLEVAALSERLYEYNAATTGFDDGQELAIFLRGEDGEIRGGLYGWTWAGQMQIQYLWLHESLRGQGHGSRLVADAERTGRERGCGVAFVETHTYQAPAFYRAHGYEVYFVQDDYPPGHQRLFFKKSLEKDGPGGDGSEP
jgi:ribosomal protein S18 acetylase RimI-like enzyme